MAPKVRAPLQLQSVTTGYDGIPVIRKVSLSFPRAQITTIIGSNGAGKSTAIKAAAGLLKVWSGRVLAEGEDITNEPAHFRVRRGIAFVPQGRVVLPEMTVRENLELGAHILASDRARIDNTIAKLVTMFPILGERMHQLAGTMSGGEQQMLAIARALMTAPSIIILDEPSLGLSPKFVDIVFQKLVELRNSGLTVIMVEQKASRALSIANYGYVMHMGQVAYQGDAAGLLANANVRRIFLGEVPEDAQFGEDNFDEI